MKLGLVISQDQGNGKCDNNINQGKEELENDNTRKMFVQQMRILGNIPVIEIRDPQIQDDIEKERKIEYDKIKAVICLPHKILNVPVNSKNKNGFDQKVK